MIFFVLFPIFKIFSVCDGRRRHCIFIIMTDFFSLCLSLLSPQTIIKYLLLRYFLIFKLFSWKEKLVRIFLSHFWGFYRRIWIWKESDYEFLILLFRNLCSNLSNRLKNKGEKVQIISISVSSFLKIHKGRLSFHLVWVSFSEILCTAEIDRSTNGFG